MLDLARASSCSEDVRWINGGVEKLAGFEADLVIMTGHVALFFLDDSAWQTAVTNVSRILRPGGRFVFESRVPSTDPFSDWPTDASRQHLHDPNVGDIEWWYEPLEMCESNAKYENHYLFSNSGEELVSHNELRFRTEGEIREALTRAGLSIRSTFGDWDSSPISESSPEMIFVAELRR